MKRFLLAFSILLAAQFAVCQSFDWVTPCGGPLGDYGNSIATDDAGNTYVTGWFQLNASFGSTLLTSAGGFDFFLVKTDINGQVMWALKGGGTGSDIGYGIVADHSGNIYVAGTFEGSAVIGGQTINSFGGPDMFVAKFSDSGILRWIQTGGSADDDQAQSIAFDNYRSIYISGYFKQTATFSGHAVSSSGNSDAFLAAYDTAGNFKWVKKSGGDGYDIGYGVTANANGKIFQTGTFQGDASFDTHAVTSNGLTDGFITQYDSSGNCNWVFGFGGAEVDEGIAVTASGNHVYATGWFSGTATFGSISLSGFGLDDIFILSLDTIGNLQWLKNAGGTGYDQSYGIATDADGNLYLTGSFDNMASFDAFQLISNGSWDIFLAKYNAATGEAGWAISAGSPAYDPFDKDIGYGITLDQSSNIYVTGIFVNEAAFGPFSATSLGVQDIFISKLNQLATASEDMSRLNESVKLYPNPANSNIIIDLNAIKDVTKIEVYNYLTLRSVDEIINNFENHLEIPLSNYADGLYLVVISGGGKTYLGKFVKTH